MLTEAHLQKLRSINSIEALLAFLKNELHWPLGSDAVDDLTFQYEPEDLGLKEEHAPKINKVYQIRPITSDQPWGIFFIDFENKKLPVTLMRRILNHLRVKNQGRTGQWDAGDLLFMTTYGEEFEGMREVAFAHFHQAAGDLPTLNVLQWDAQDATAKLQTTYDTLKENLGWPEDATNQDAWREQWRKPFKHKIGHVITTAKALAERLAELSRMIRDRVSEVLEAETEKGPMTKLFTAFKEALIHDLKPADFADTFAQTITYGLFSAAVSRRYPEERGTKSLTTETIAEIVPETNPFLREVLATFLDVGGRKKGGIDFDELGVQDVVELLRSDETDMKSILEDFGNRKQGEDPVIHFYEDYLRAYNKELKVKRGVFYTPQPVVSYIVRSVHELLQTEFGLEDGLASTVTWGEMASRTPSPTLVGEGEGGEGSGITIPAGTEPDSPFVVILDPATGTATFLVEVIDVIHKHVQKKWNQDREGCIRLLRHLTTNNQLPSSFPDFWNAYVPDHLLPRLYGYELMMAPYAIAHMKVGLKLGETGYRFGSSQRVRIYLTNALEPASELQARLALDWEALAHEAMAVKAVKETQRFTVVIGNPPYSGLSANLTDQARSLVARFKFIDGVKLDERGALQLEKNLQDDYVKFLAVVEDSLAASDIGVCGIICNHGFIDNPTLRGLRWSLRSTFNHIWVLDLHGNVIRGETAPDGSPDQNVFDIKDAGVSIFLGSYRRAQSGSNSHIRKQDVWGDREQIKYPFLASNQVSNTIWDTVPCEPELFLFRRLGGAGDAEYSSWVKVTSLFPLHSIGIITARDAYVIDFEPKPIVERAVAFRDSQLDDEQTCKALGIPVKKGWNIRRARERIRKQSELEAFIRPLLYRPFDIRPVFYHESLIWGMAAPVMQHMVSRSNLALITSRMTKGEPFEHVLVSNGLSEVILLSSKTSNNAFAFPLSRFPSAKEAAMGIGKEPNLSPAFLDALAGAIGRRFESGGSPGGLFAGGNLLVEVNQPTLGAFGEGLSSDQGSLATAPDPAVYPSGPSFSPEDVLHYIYAVLHSPAYRSRYAEFLKIDFPRIPLPGSAALFDALVPLGAELVALHLMESPRLDTPMTTFLEPTGLLGESIVEKVTYVDQTVFIDKSQTVGFQGVPEEVWSFHIGGYQVCEKWLKDRGPKKGKPGRVLSAEDIAHYHKIVVALNETIRLMREIDEVIDTHGDWPGAFAGAVGNE